jgi:hypothetical protein
LTNEEVERFYESMANTIDQVGEKKANIFLAKLTLLFAKNLNNFDKSISLIEEAAFDLDS